MTRKILILFSLQLLSCSIYGQNIAGTWYEINDPNAGLEITLEKNNDSYSGIYTWEWKNRTTTLNAPLDHVMLKKDSLLIGLKYANYAYNFKLKWDDQTDTYHGFYYRQSRQVAPVTFSRNPVERDLTMGMASEKRPTRQDTLRGKITKERAWWDLTHYTLDFELDIENKYIKGSNTITYTVLEPKNIMQIDLQPPMKITKVYQAGESLTFTQEGNAYFVELSEVQVKGTSREVEVFYEGDASGNPNRAWGGGLTYQQDANGNPFIFTSCQGTGSSLWWPGKDHMYDEPDDGMTIRITVPDGLMAVANGKHTATEKKDNGTTTYQWTVVNPINSYGVSLNVADYVHFSDIYNGKKGALQCDYYVLPENLEKARIQFKQAHLMLEAFEYWFGPYPFYEDSYKLVDGIGMEHQSSIGYSGGYINGYVGNDISGSGWGLKFDYLIIHESGHEWFANNITYKDMADMWVHEGFTTYSEALYVEYHFGKKAGDEFVKGLSQSISNDKPMIGNYDINDTDYTRDVYLKGAVLLHTLRQVINDDQKWREILTGLNTEFYHQTVTSVEVEDYISEQSGLDLSTFFDQYLRTIQIPTLEYYFKDKVFAYRWINTIPGFDMPLKVKLDNKEQWIQPTTNWIQEHMKDPKNELTIDPNFYVAGFRNMIK